MVKALPRSTQCTKMEERIRQVKARHLFLQHRYWRQAKDIEQHRYWIMQIMSEYNEYLDQYYVTSSQFSTQANYGHPQYSEEFMYHPNTELAARYPQFFMLSGINPMVVTPLDEQALKRVVRYILEKLW